MGKIQAGINENVVMMKPVVKTETGVMSLVFKTLKEGENEEDFDPMAFISSNSIEIETDETSNIPVFKFNATKKDGTPIETEMIKKDVSSVATMLVCLAKCLKSDANPFSNSLRNIDKPTEGTIAEKMAAVNELFKDPATLNIIYSNYVEDFIGFYDELSEEEKSTPLRLKMWRSNKKQTYVSIPKPGGKGYGSEPFVELMSVPKEASRLRFSPYELGLNKEGNIDPKYFDKSSNEVWMEESDAYQTSVEDNSDIC